MTRYNLQPIRVLRLVLCAMLFYFVAEVTAQIPNTTTQDTSHSEPQAIRIVIDIASLQETNSQLLGQVAKALLKSSATDTSEQALAQEDYATSKSGDLYRIIAERYGFSVSNPKSRPVAEAIAENIRNINGLGKYQRLIAKSFKIPPFFHQAAKGTSNYSQYWGRATTSDRIQIVNNSVLNSDVLLATDSVATASVNNIEPEEVPLVQITLNSEQYARFAQMLGSAELHKLAESGSSYITTQDDTVDIDHPENALIPAAISSGVVLPSAAPRTDLDPDVGIYYIIDFFHRKEEKYQNLSHGDIVLKIARRSLKDYGAQSLTSIDEVQFVEDDFFPQTPKDRIQPVEVDFFYNKGKASQLVEEYLKKANLTDILKNDMRARLAYLQQIQPRPGQKITSLLYLQALYGLLLSRSDTAVISSSTYFSFDGFQPVPKLFNGDSSVPLLNAVSNDSGSRIDSQPYEPINYFFNTSQKLGTILVGATKGDSFEGMSDWKKMEGGVTSIAAGQWQVAIDPEGAKLDVWGTSFATPAIGSLLLTAKAFWKSNQKQYNALKIRRRLLLASQPQVNLIGFFASGGVPRLDKLLILDQAILIDKNGLITGIDLGDSSVKIGHRSPGLSNTPGNGDISGLIVFDTPSADPNGCNAFVFYEDNQRWVCRHIDDVSINFTVNGILTTLTWPAFTSTYKELIIP